MTGEQLKKGEEALEKLSSIMNDLHLENDINHYLEIGESQEATIILGNTEGLIYLATSILDLALSEIDGKHYHFDVGALENCDKELEVLYKSIPPIN